MLAVARADQECAAGGVVVDVGHIGERDPGRAAELEPGTFALESERARVDEDLALAREAEGVVERLVRARRLTGGEVHAEFFQAIVPVGGVMVPGPGSTYNIAPMKIVILGAGQVGRTAAYHLSREEANEVTVVDTNEEVLRDLQDRLDIRTVAGNAAYPSVLEAAGCASADIVVALTSSDEVNMMACEVAYTLYRTRTKIARIRSSEYTRHPKLFADEALSVDVWISPEQLVTEYVAELIKFPGALQVLDFADGRVRLVGIRARKGGLLVSQKLAALKEHHPNTEARVVAIYRAGRSIRPEGDTVITVAESRAARSTPKSSPAARAASCRALSVTPAPTVTCRASWSTGSIALSRRSDSRIPPGGVAPATSEVLPPCRVTVVRNSPHAAMAAATSAVLPGRTTHSATPRCLPVQSVT